METRLQYLQSNFTSKGLFIKGLELKICQLQSLNIFISRTGAPDIQQICLCLWAARPAKLNHSVVKFDIKTPSFTLNSGKFFISHLSELLQ